MKPGDKVKLKLTGEEVFILEIGPRSKSVTMITSQGPMMTRQEYIPENMVQVRCKDMAVYNIFDFEIEGVEWKEDITTLEGNFSNN